jgi:hypothetical protein
MPQQLQRNNENVTAFSLVDFSGVLFELAKVRHLEARHRFGIPCHRYEFNAG